MIKRLRDHKKAVLIALGVIAIIAFTIYKMVFNHTDQAIPAAKATAVQIYTVKPMKFNSVTLYKANLELLEQGIISSKIDGQVKEILFENGDHVAQGQPLVILDDSDLAFQLSAAQVKVQALERILASARKQYNRMKALYDNGALSQSELEAADTELKTAEADLAAENINVQSINNSLNNTRLCSPVSGVINEKDVRKGQYVSPGLTLAKVNNNSALFALTEISLEDLKQVKVGQHVVVKLTKNDEKKFTGIFDAVDDSANDSTRLFPCRIRVDNSDGCLHSGVFGYVEIPFASSMDSLVIPLAAVMGSSGDYSVFTAEKNVARRHSVTIGRMGDNLVQVQTGLQAGDQVIVTNLNALADGDSVRVCGQGV